MCIKKVTWHQCPQTDEGMAARANYPRDTMIKLGDAWRLARVYHATFTTVLDERLRPGMQYHVHETFVYCAHPYHGPCAADYGLVCQLAEGECPACVHDKGLPRRITARRDVMDGVLPLLTGEFLRPSQAVLEYVAQLAVLAKHMVARKVPNVVLRGAMVDQLVREVRAELFCRSFDAHWVGPGIAGCGCFAEDHGYCANLGRFLRQQEAGRILDFHRDIVVPYVNVPDPDEDDWELVLARETVAEWFVDRRRARFDKVAICRFDTNPREDQRYHDCLQRLDAAVIRYIDLLRFALGGGPDRGEEPDDRAAAAVERSLRARAVFLRKPLQWVAYDAGLADGLVEEISEVVIHWYLRVGTPLSPPVENAAWPAPLQLRRDVDAARRDMQATTEHLDAVFSTGDRAGWRLFRDHFLRPPVHEELEVHTLRRGRAELTAAAEARLVRAQTAADECVVSVAAARGLRGNGNGNGNDEDEDDDDDECPVCGGRFADDPAARRPVVVCARRHLVCRECTVTHVLNTGAHLLEHDPQKLARCPMCRGSMAGFYRANPDPADALRSPPVPAERAVPVVWS